MEQKAAVERNIPQEAINKANRSQQMQKLNREQFITRWFFNIGALTGLYEVRDSLQNEFWNMVTLNIQDLRTFVIVELVGISVITSRVVGAHFEKQKNAIRLNNINREIQKENPDYSPALLPEGHLDQYKDTGRNLADSFRRRFKI